MRVAFAGTPEFARVALEAIVAAGFTVPLVLTQPDRPAGRGMKLQPSPVKQFALTQGTPVAQPTSLRLDGKYPAEAAAAQAALRAAAPDVLVVAAYGLILPRWVLDLPRLGCLNIHGSLLPRWRGAAPIYRAIEAGDAETGITIMQMDEGLDTGDMLLIAREPIGAADSTARLHDRLATLGGALIVEALDQAAAGALQATRQPAEGVTYAHKIEKAEAAIDWALPAAQIERRVRAFDPFPGANFQRGADTIKVWQAECVAGEGEPGEVLATSADGIVVACGEGALRLTQLQRPGGKRAAARELLAALPIAVGERLGERIDGLAG
ncbi:MAG TPA: methionyl-tRNA formyltransferase [Burkholderiaceae bacterium]|nr:methionyl-tRNA formyltransferase [Burkholderiaceae bacterium]HMX09974.1 methionyl-tRNA formyltransferase [Burkholderiaceae bacterium]HMY99805.1 methionyl-tRNA formyltransferase [Burkholderiaceae bacterium]HNB45663.1 methionyl-tRNA formyltransferase [Burkholderiaceae bacterium]HNG78842.1 methionyl-tRNA formyltransferase [Burkholderiaceae bacterium]